MSDLQKYACQLVTAVVAAVAVSSITDDSSLADAADKVTITVIEHADS